MLLKLIGEIVGYIAVVSAFVMFQQTDRKRLIFCKLIIDILWVIHFGFLGGYTGLCITAINVGRELIFMNRDKPIFKSKLWLCMFIALYAVTPVFTWQGAVSIFPAVSATIASISFWSRSVKKTKLLSALVSLNQFVYEASIHYYSAMTNEVVTLTSIFISFIRTKTKKSGAEV